MSKSLVLLALTAVVAAIYAAGAGATIHPLVASFACANETAIENAQSRGFDDVSDPPGQSPAEAFPDAKDLNHSEQSSFRAIQEANAKAWKFDPETFTPNNPALSNCANSPLP